MRIILLSLLAATLSSQTPNAGQTAAPPAMPTIAAKTAGMRAAGGFLPFHWDARAGKIWLELSRFGAEMLYVVSLPAGVGSNDIGLDRGQIRGEKIVRFERSGPKVLLVEPNYAFRANTESADERRSVEEAYAQSVLWGFEIVAEEGDRVLVDATAFFLRDAHGVAERLRTTQQGTWRADPSRSALYEPRTRSFPKNTEVEAIVTLTGENAGQFLRSVAPSADTITVRQRHSFVELPGGYTPRPYDPRSGFFSIDFMDFATPIGEPIRKRNLVRHRLEKRPDGTVAKPIVYYLDRGAPEPIRSALLEGARWWTQAFEAAGFRDAFRVELLPEDADPLDIRYNVIQWVHRSTRGWSYGNAVTDPRTGEILKGHVTLGSLRVRQDYLIAEGLLAPYENGKPVAPEMERMALARLRQLSAHEVGHTLGLHHNFAASVSARASVMDYPHPLAVLRTGGEAPDLSDAYGTGVGEWDKVAIRFGYGEPADESVLRAAHARGLRFIFDAPAAGPHPQAHVWDNGTSAVDELNRIMNVRAAALARFSENNIRPGTPMALLEDVLVPIYLGHRYQVEAASKLLGGLDYAYSLRGDTQTVTELVPAAEQHRALRALLATLDPAALRLPDRILRLIPPRPPSYERHRGTFRSRTGVTFDPASAAEAAASITITQLLHPERAARLVEYHAREASLPAFSDVTAAVLNATWKAKRPAGLAAEAQRTVNSVVLYHLMSVASAETAAPQVRAVAADELASLRKWATARAAAESDRSEQAHLRFAAAQIERFERDPKTIPVPRPADPPPGQPIGCEDYTFVGSVK